MAYAEPSARLLVLGEADFSFGAALLRLCADGVRLRHMACTSFDERATLHSKYGAAAVEGHVAKLKAVGATVLHGIDATRMSQVAAVANRAPFDIIVFPFPHAGGAGGLAASIEENRGLLRELIAEAPKVLALDGELHVTLVHRYPYTAWIDGLTAPPNKQKKAGKKAKNAKKKKEEEHVGGAHADADAADADASGSLCYLGAQTFDFDVLPGYQHRATSRVEGNDGGALDVSTACVTHVWRMERSSL
jgi:hypothetical protein